MTYLRIFGQLVVTLALFAGVAAATNWPVYRQTPPNTGILVLTFVHGAGRGECRRRSPEEIAKLPPNMRQVQDCPRGRQSLYVELDLNERALYRATLAPTGLAGDGPSRAYQRFVLPIGEYDVTVRMRDTPRQEGFDYERMGRIALASDQMFVIDFQPENGGFVFR